MILDDWFTDPAPAEITKVVPGATIIPTTDKMDGLFTAEDKANKHKVMMQCNSCGEWTQNEVWQPPAPCTGCGSKQYDPTSTISLRTFNPLTAKRRKIKSKRK